MKRALYSIVGSISVNVVHKCLGCAFRCSRLGLTSLAYLWQRDQQELLQEMIAAGVKAIIIKVASLGMCYSVVVHGFII